jgi:hypothetical protein
LEQLKNLKVLSPFLAEINVFIFKYLLKCVELECKFEFTAFLKIIFMSKEAIAPVIG